MAAISDRVPIRNPHLKLKSEYLQGDGTTRLGPEGHRSSPGYHILIEWTSGQLPGKFQEGSLHTLQQAARDLPKEGKAGSSEKPPGAVYKDRLEDLSCRRTGLKTTPPGPDWLAAWVQESWHTKCSEDNASALRTMLREPQHVTSGLSWCQPRGPHIKCLVSPKPKQVGFSLDSKGSSLSPESDCQHPR